MAIYAIGDVHACLSELTNLLAAIDFQPQRDRLWFVGDFINRGPESLQTLRFIRLLGDDVTVVMGNHEGRAIAALSGWHDAGLASFLQALQTAPDAAELEMWLRNIPLYHCDQTLGIGMVHAGISPAWSMKDVCWLSREVSQILRDPKMSQVFFQNRDDFALPAEPAGTNKIQRLRFAFSIMTRIRMCTPEGSPLWPTHPLLAGLANPYAFVLSEDIALPFRPWFELRPQGEGVKIVYGHWAAAGLNLNANTWGLDSGCVYGGKLTAIRLDHPDYPITQVDCQRYINPAFGENAATKIRSDNPKSV